MTARALCKKPPHPLPQMHFAFSAEEAEAGASLPAELQVLGNSQQAVVSPREAITSAPCLDFTNLD